ncbi:MAG: GDP-4-dehydro-6-deoxy-D-mannose reductase [Solirubrobacteraceae bacterium]|nr:GDP-4-dehydro-6-deoxy-D-mannose reductase [Solirubrobacteraceae bacterium]
MRALITGAAGFVGGHLATLAADRGADAVGLGRDPSGPPTLSAYVQADLGDAAATRAAVAELKPDAVFHLAADASVGRSWQAPAETFENNTRATLNLLEAVRAEAPDAVVLHAGSGEQYGPVPEERLPITEDEPLRPQNPYAVSKSAADLLAGFYADAHGMRVIRTRAFNHAGPGQSDSYVVAAFARQIAEAERAGRSELVLETGNLAPRRDFCDVRDVVRAYWLAAERGEAAIFNVCSGVSRPVADILAGLARLTEVAVEQRTDPARLRQHEVMDIRGSHARLTEATGWQPEIALEQTLADTLDWWRANG